MNAATGRWAAWWLRPRGDVIWDGVVRSSALLAAAGIALALFAAPAVGGLVGFIVVTMWVNGPVGIFLPATYEPIVMLFGRLYPPLWVALAGVLGSVYVEFLNYHLYARILHAPRLALLRENAVVQRMLPLFQRAPFFTVWLCSWSPLPHWTVRVLAPLGGYSVTRFLCATALGRFPRLWFFAALGALPIPPRVLMGAVALGIMVALGLLLGRPISTALRRRAAGATGAVQIVAPPPSQRAAAIRPSTNAAIPRRSRSALARLWVGSVPRKVTRTSTRSVPRA